MTSFVLILLGDLVELVQKLVTLVEQERFIIILFFSVSAGGNATIAFGSSTEGRVTGFYTNSTKNMLKTGHFQRQRDRISTRYQAFALSEFGSL